MVLAVDRWSHYCRGEQPVGAVSAIPVCRHRRCSSSLQERGRQQMYKTGCPGAGNQHCEVQGPQGQLEPVQPAAQNGLRPFAVTPTACRHRRRNSGQQKGAHSFRDRKKPAYRECHTTIPRGAPSFRYKNKPAYREGHTASDTRRSQGVGPVEGQAPWEAGGACLASRADEAAIEMMGA